MKNSIILLLTSICFFHACKKTDEAVSTTKASLAEMLARTQIPADVNATVIRISQDVADPAYEVGIIDNANHGGFSSTPGNDIFFAGVAEPGYSISLNGTVYNADAAGGWMKQGIALKNYYGKDVAVVVKKGTQTQSFNVYVPTPALAQKLNIGQTQKIARVGKKLLWNADTKNPANKVAFYYELFDNENVGSPSGSIKSELLLINNNGQYDLDNILSNPAAKRIYFRLVTGNTISTNFNNKKMLFYISSFDHHEYLL